MNKHFRYIFLRQLCSSSPNTSRFAIISFHFLHLIKLFRFFNLYFSSVPFHIYSAIKQWTNTCLCIYTSGRPSTCKTWQLSKNQSWLSLPWFKGFFGCGTCIKWQCRDVQFVMLVYGINFMNRLLWNKLLTVVCCPIHWHRWNFIVLLLKRNLIFLIEFSPKLNLD